MEAGQAEYRESLLNGEKERMRKSKGWRRKMIRGGER